MDKEKEEFKSKSPIKIQSIYKKGQNLYGELLKSEKKIKVEFHGNRDFYNIISSVAIEGSKLANFGNDIIPYIESYIERNFGGINCEIDIDFSLIPKDSSKEMSIIKAILQDKKSKKKDIINTNEENVKKVI